MRESERRAIPDGVWIKCEDCGETLFAREFERNGKVCPHCQRHGELSAEERVRFIADDGEFKPLPGYPNVLRASVRIASIPVAVGVVDAEAASEISTSELFEAFAELATFDLPVAAVIAGGAGRQSSARHPATRLTLERGLRRLSEAKLPYLLVITDGRPDLGYSVGLPPGDVVLAEASGRDHPPVKLDSPFPFIDGFVTRSELKDQLSKLVAFFHRQGG